MSTNVAGVYITGLFGQGGLLTPTKTELLNSKMNDYIFWSVHVNADASLHYNNEPLAENGTLNAATAGPIGDIISDAKQAGLVSSVWFSIGAGGVSDFQNIQSILDKGGTLEKTLYANLKALMGLGATGFDLDYEEDLSDPSAFISRFTVGLNQKLGARVTYCPYYGPQMWIDALIANQKALGRQPVKAFNLQCYSGGGGNDPRTWVQAIRDAGRATGVSDPNGFVRPGMAVAGSVSAPALSPSQMTDQLNGWGSPGGWIWNSANVLKNQQSQGYSIPDYAGALLDAQLVKPPEGTPAA
ncbi:hypothetical protein [Maricaulis sp.]|uniref:hypothetical protein n=1 Tax=Maricaulis sp. TaxID=1486257 RepID=UPI00261BA827|nr:hypothetical protein [Maricaulis sp.]